MAPTIAVTMTTKVSFDGIFAVTTIEVLSSMVVGTVDCVDVSFDDAVDADDVADDCFDYAVTVTMIFVALGIRNALMVHCCY